LNVNEDCSNFDSLPDLTIELNGKEFVMKPSEYILKTKDDSEMGDYDEEYDENSPEFLAKWNGKYQCAPAFMAIDVPAPRGPIFIIGDTFMRKYYTVFDRTKNAIGFALAVTNNTKVNSADIENPYEEQYNDEIIDEILSLSKGQ